MKYFADFCVPFVIFFFTKIKLAKFCIHLSNYNSIMFSLIPFPNGNTRPEPLFVARVYTGGKMDSDSIQRAVPIIQVKEFRGLFQLFR